MRSVWTPHAAVELRLTQSASAITGEISAPADGCGRLDAHTSRVDPAAPGRVDANGNFQMRIKDISWGGDMFLKGVVEPDRITGTATYQWHEGFDVIQLYPAP